MAQPLIVGPREGAMPYMGRVYKQFSVGWEEKSEDFDLE